MHLPNRASWPQDTKFVLWVAIALAHGNHNQGSYIFTKITGIFVLLINESIKLIMKLGKIYSNQGM